MAEVSAAMGIPRYRCEGSSPATSDVIAPPSLEGLRSRREEILSIADRYGIEGIRVFGSVVRGRAVEGSDIDLLVRFPEDASLLDHVGFMQELEDLLHTHVDVVSEPALHWYIRERVLSEAVPL